MHYGRTAERQAIRQETLTAAYTAHPERFVRQAPTPPALPTAAWINKPAAAGPQAVTEETLAPTQ